VRPGRTAGVSKSPLRVFSHGKFGPLCFVRTSCYSLEVSVIVLFMSVNQELHLSSMHERGYYILTYASG